MTKKEAKDLLIANACCNFGTLVNGLCSVCPFYSSEKCSSSVFSEENIIQAINVMKGVKTMKLADIKVTKAFLNSVPSNEKIQECEEYYRKGKQKKLIVVDRSGTLKDGYIQYIVFKNHNVQEAEVKILNKKKGKIETPSYKNQATTYIFGIHPNSQFEKEYCWRVPERKNDFAKNIQVGDTILCTTKFGTAPVTVTKIEILDKPPIDSRIKKICTKKIWRDGILVMS